MTMADTRSGNTSMPRYEVLWPRKSTSRVAKTHFFLLRVTPSFINRSSTIFKTLLCFSIDSAKINIIKIKVINVNYDIGYVG